MEGTEKKRKSKRISERKKKKDKKGHGDDDVKTKPTESEPAEKPGTSTTDSAKPESETSPRTSNNGSPDPNCPICLGKIQNKSFTDSCFHTFCYVCLKEWTKVKAECPLCKQKFTSILYNVKSYEKYDQIQVSEIQGTNQQDWDNPQHRFRYRTTLTLERRLLMDFPPNARTGIEHDYTLFHRPSRHSQVTTRANWRRRREAATSDFRRRVYANGLRVNRLTEARERDISPDFYRSNPAQTHRLVPWLNRELNALLRGQVDDVQFVLDLIMRIIAIYPINSEQFYNQLYPYVGRHTRHFMHEFEMFAKSPHNMAGYDQRAIYEQQNYDVIPLEVDNDSTSEEGDDDDVIILSPAVPTIDLSQDDSPEITSTSGLVPPPPPPPPPPPLAAFHQLPLIPFHRDPMNMPLREPPAERRPATFSDVTPIIERVRQFLEAETAGINLGATGWDSPTPGPSWGNMNNSSNANDAAYLASTPPLPSEPPPPPPPLPPPPELPPLPPLPPDPDAPTQEDGKKKLKIPSFPPMLTELFNSARIKIEDESDAESIYSSSSDVIYVKTEQRYEERPAVVLSSESDEEVAKKTKLAEKEQLKLKRKLLKAAERTSRREKKRKLSKSPSLDSYSYKDSVKHSSNRQRASSPFSNRQRALSPPSNRQRGLSPSISSNRQRALSPSTSRSRSRSQESIQKRHKKHKKHKELKKHRSERDDPYFDRYGGMVSSSYSRYYDYPPEYYSRDKSSKSVEKERKKKSQEHSKSRYAPEVIELGRYEQDPYRSKKRYAEDYYESSRSRKSHTVSIRSPSPPEYKVSKSAKLSSKEKKREADLEPISPDDFEDIPKKLKKHKLKKSKKHKKSKRQEYYESISSESDFEVVHVSKKDSKEKTKHKKLPPSTTSSTHKSADVMPPTEKRRSSKESVPTGATSPTETRRPSKELVSSNAVTSSKQRRPSKEPMPTHTMPSSEQHRSSKESVPYCAISPTEQRRPLKETVPDQYEEYISASKHSKYKKHPTGHKKGSKHKSYSNYSLDSPHHSANQLFSEEQKTKGKSKSSGKEKVQIEENMEDSNSIIEKIAGGQLCLSPVSDTSSNHTIEYLNTERNAEEIQEVETLIQHSERLPEAMGGQSEPQIVECEEDVTSGLLDAGEIQVVNEEVSTAVQEEITSAIHEEISDVDMSNYDSDLNTDPQGERDRSSNDMETDKREEENGKRDSESDANIYTLEGKTRGGNIECSVNLEKDEHKNQGSDHEEIDNDTEKQKVEYRSTSSNSDCYRKTDTQEEETIDSDIECGIKIDGRKDRKTDIEMEGLSEKQEEKNRSCDIEGDMKTNEQEKEKQETCIDYESSEKYADFDKAEMKNHSCDVQGDMNTDSEIGHVRDDETVIRANGPNAQLSSVEGGSDHGERHQHTGGEFREYKEGSEKEDSVSDSFYKDAQSFTKGDSQTSMDACPEKFIESAESDTSDSVHLQKYEAKTEDDSIVDNDLGSESKEDARNEKIMEHD